MHKRHLLFWMSALGVCAFLAWLLSAIPLPFVARLPLLAVPPGFFILLALLLVPLVAAQAAPLTASGYVGRAQELLLANPGPAGLRHRVNEGASKTGEPLARGATYWATPLSSIWSGGKAFSSVDVIVGRICPAGSHYMASPPYPGEASG